MVVLFSSFVFLLPLFLFMFFPNRIEGSIRRVSCVSILPYSCSDGHGIAHQLGCSFSFATVLLYTGLFISYTRHPFHDYALLSNKLIIPFCSDFLMDPRLTIFSL